MLINVIYFIFGGNKGSKEFYIKGSKEFCLELLSVYTTFDERTPALLLIAYNTNEEPGEVWRFDFLYISALLHYLKSRKISK